MSVIEPVTGMVFDATGRFHIIQEEWKCFLDGRCEVAAGGANNSKIGKALVTRKLP